MQCANSELIAQALTQKRHHQNLSVILILQSLYCQGKVMRNVDLNTEYVLLFHNPRDKSQFGHLARQLEPKHPKALVDAYVATFYSDGTTHIKQHRSKRVQPNGSPCANNHCSTRYERSFRHNKHTHTNQKAATDKHSRHNH